MDEFTDATGTEQKRCGCGCGKQMVKESNATAYVCHSCGAVDSQDDSTEHSKSPTGRGGSHGKR